MESHDKNSDKFEWQYQNAHAKMNWNMCKVSRVHVEMVMMRNY